MNITRAFPTEFMSQRPLAVQLLEAATTWPTPIELPAPVVTAVERVEQVMGAQAPATVPLTVDEFLTGKLDKWALAKLANAEHDEIRAQVLRTARAEAITTVDVHAEEIWSQLNASLAVAWERQLTHDLAAVDRVSVADAAHLGDTARSRLTEATEARDVIAAAKGLAWAACRAQQEMPSIRAEPLLISEVTTTAAVVEYHDGFNIHGLPKRGGTPNAWAALCRFTPSICRSRQQLEDRFRAYGKRTRHRDPDWTPEELAARASASDIAQAAERLKAS